MTDRIIDNLIKNDVKLSVVNWNKIENNLFSALKFLINATRGDKARCNYDLSVPMRHAISQACEL